MLESIRCPSLGALKLGTARHLHFQFAFPHAGQMSQQVPTQLRKPRVDDWNQEVFKVRDVTGCERGMVSEHDPSNHRIAQVTRPTFLLPRRH
jgi:hypothetical protein